MCFNLLKFKILILLYIDQYGKSHNKYNFYLVDYIPTY